MIGPPKVIFILIHSPPSSRNGLFIQKKDIIYIFLERGEGKKKERDRNINMWLPLAHPLLRTWPIIQACALTGSQIGNLLVHRSTLNPLSYASQDHRLWSYENYFLQGKNHTFNCFVVCIVDAIMFFK